jgi:hypothetical protein
LSLSLSIVERANSREARVTHQIDDDDDYDNDSDPDPAAGWAKRQDGANTRTIVVQ